MNGKKIILLFLALLLPICIFLFLRIFGKNEFNVEPLFQSEKPALAAGCPDVTIPYVIRDYDVLNDLFSSGDSLVMIYFAPDTISATSRQFERIKAEFKNEPVSGRTMNLSFEQFKILYSCIFLMEQPNDIVLIDRTGLIRGQYESAERDEIDRLKTEITIILKRY